MLRSCKVEAGGVKVTRFWQELGLTKIDFGGCETIHPKKFYSSIWFRTHPGCLFLQHNEAITENLSNFIRFNKHIHLSSKGNLKINKNPISVIWCLFPWHGGYDYCQTPNTNFFDPHRMSQLLKAISIPGGVVQNTIPTHRRLAYEWG